MAIKKKKKAKEKRVEITLWDKVLSFPDLHDPKPYNGKVTYKTDILFDEDDEQLEELQELITELHTTAWGDDESEWPDEKIIRIKDGSEREDQKAYKGKMFITAKSDFPVTIKDFKGRDFNAQLVRGGMFANVALDLACWDNDFGEGSSAYLAGIQIDTTKKALAFGGGKPFEERFKKKGKLANDDADEVTDDEPEEDEDDQPKKKKSGFKKKIKNDEEE